jgi:hypothetical protein
MPAWIDQPNCTRRASSNRCRSKYSRPWLRVARRSARERSKAAKSTLAGQPEISPAPRHVPPPMHSTTPFATPSTLGCEECLKDWFAMGPPAPMPDLRPRPLLRRLAEPPRHEALPQDASSDHRRLQPARMLGVVLRRRDYARSQRSRHAAQRSDPALLLKRQRNRRIRGYVRARDLARAHSEPRPLTAATLRPRRHEADRPGPSGSQLTPWRRGVDSNFRFRDALSSPTARPWSRRLIRR